MKWIAAILMILNVVIFLGVSDRQTQAGQGSAATRPDVNRESMLLLKEVAVVVDAVRGGRSPTVVRAPDLSGIDGAVVGALDAQNLALVNSQTEGASQPGDGAILDLDATGRNGSASAGADQSANITTVDVENSAQASKTAATEDDDPDVLAEPPELANLTPDSALCYRVGPFKDQSLWRRATQWAETEGLVFKPVRSQSRELRAVRVYVGPFRSISAAQPEADVLKEKELDYFVYLHDSNEARISLGYFTQEELATKFVEYLKSQDIAARSQPEYRTLGPFDWMDINISTTARSRIVNRDWGDDGVLVSERECGAG